MTTLTTTELPAGLTSGTWNIDPSHTEAGFTVRHAGISKVRGSVAVTSGAITVGATLPESTVSVTLDPATISTGDAGRDGHLKSGDFFEVETYPTWTFTSTAVRVEGDVLVVVGDLTIHGATRSVELTTEFNGTATDPFGNLRAGFEGSVTINRKDYGITWNAALETGGVLVGEKITLEFEVSAIKSA